MSWECTVTGTATKQTSQHRIQVELMELSSYSNSRTYKYSTSWTASDNINILHSMTYIFQQKWSFFNFILCTCYSISALKIISSSLFNAQYLPTIYPLVFAQQSWKNGHCSEILRADQFEYRFLALFAPVIWKKEFHSTSYFISPF